MTTFPKKLERLDTRSNWYQSLLGQKTLAELDEQLSELMSEIFGYYAIEIGTLSGQHDFLEFSRIAAGFSLSNKSNSASVISTPEQIPIATDNVDLVIASHVLETSTEPHQVLREIYSKMEFQEKALEKKDTIIKQKSFDELEVSAREKIRKQNKDYFRRLGQLERKDYFTLFLNAINGSYDPHTRYFPPKDKEDFDIRMSGQLEGIGATLQEKDGYIKVVNIVS